MIIEAYFIFKKENNKIIGNPLGYKTYGQAVNDIYNIISDKYKYFLSTPSEIENSNLLYYDKVNNGYIKYRFNNSKWIKHCGEPYLKEHYNIVKKEFKIVFTDDI